MTWNGIFTQKLPSNCCFKDHKISLPIAHVQCTIERKTGWFDAAAFCRGGGSGYTKQIFIKRGSAPWVQPLSFLLLYSIFDRKDTPFVYLPSTNGTLFTEKPERFFDFFTAMKCICKTFWAFFPDKRKDFPSLSYTSTYKISTLFYAPEPENGTWPPFEQTPLPPPPYSI